MTCWEFYGDEGTALAVVFSGAVARVLYTELTQSDFAVYVRVTRI